MRPKWEAIRGLDIRVFSAGFIVAPILEKVVFRVGTLPVSHINLRVNLVDLFRQYFILLSKVILVLMIALFRVVITL